MTFRHRATAIRWSLGHAASAVLVLSPGPALAVCDNTAPASGTVVVCSGASPVGVDAQPGSTGVTITIDPGAVVGGPFGAAVQSGSRIDNAGTVNATAGNAGLAARLDDNRITNLGTGLVVTTGAGSRALLANGNRNTLINLGNITVGGANSYALSALTGPGTTLVDNVFRNSGTITTTGPSGHAIFAQQNDRALLENTGTITTSGSNATGLRVVGGSNTLTNSGTLRTTGTDANAVYMQGNNNGLVNTGLIETTGAGNAEAVFSNTAGASFVTTIENAAGAEIRSTQSVAVRGLNGQETLINAGTLVGGGGTAVSLAGGNDTLVLRTGSSITGRLDGGAGNDLLRLEGNGSLASDADLFERLHMQGSAWSWSGTGRFGAVDLDSGTFTLTGLVGGAARVASGATLTGTGQVEGSLRVAGTVRPGLTPGTGVLTVDGHYIQEAGGVLAVTQTPTSADRLVVTGTADLQGGTVAVLAQTPGIYTPGVRVPIVSAAGGVTGRFDALSLPSTLFIRTTLIYDANNVYLGSFQVAPFSAQADTPNRAAVADTLDAVQPTATGTLREAVDELFSMLQPASVADALDSLGGGVVPTQLTIGWQQQQSFVRSLVERGAALRGVRPLGADTTQACLRETANPFDACDVRVWARAFATNARIDGAPGIAGAQSRWRGVALGSDARVSTDTRAGVALELAGNTAVHRGQIARGTQDSVALGAHIGGQTPRWHWGVAASLGSLRGDLSRQVVVGSLNVPALADWRARVVSAEAEIGPRAEGDGWMVEPFGSLRASRARLSPIREQGAGEAGILVAGTSVQSTAASLGVRALRRLTASAAWTLSGYVRWFRTSGDHDLRTTMAFSGAPAQRFTVSGASPARNGAALGVELTYARPSSPTRFHIGYDGLRAGGWRSHGVALRVQRPW